MTSNELNLLIKEGEGLTVEFKEKYTPKIDRDIVAIANSKGGHILLGVGDSGAIVGEVLTNKMKAEIVDLARKCDPAIDVHVNQVDKIVVVTVEEGNEKPYSCSSGYFRRLDAITQKMTQKEVALLFRNTHTVSFEERIHKDVSWNDISKEKIRAFFKEAQISVGKINVKDVLISLGLATEEGIKNAGVLFFAKDPRRHILQCETIAVSFKGTNRVDILDRNEIQNDLWTQYKDSMIFLRKHLNVRTEIKGLDRKDIYDVPLEALREAVANALIHRDYNVRGTSIMVEVHEDRVIIKNPGGFPNGMSQDKLGNLSVRRNELIADIFARMHRVERMGSGYKRIREHMEAAGLPFPTITSDEFFFIEFQRTKIKPVEGVNEGVIEGVNEGVTGDIEGLFQYIEKNPGKRVPQISKVLKVPAKTLERWLSQLKSESKVEYRGSAKTGGYFIKT
jgi:ATP-dependent DNA helicase RecG